MMILLASTSFTHFNNSPSWLLMNTSSPTNTYFQTFCFSLYSILNKKLLKYCLSSNLQSLFSPGYASAISMLFISFNPNWNPKVCKASSLATSLSLRGTWEIVTLANYCSKEWAKSKNSIRMWLLHLYSPIKCLITSWESPKILITLVPMDNSTFKPRIRTWYSAWLLEHCNSSEHIYLLSTPSGLVITIPAPAPF